MLLLMYRVSALCSESLFNYSFLQSAKILVCRGNPPRDFDAAARIIDRRDKSYLDWQVDRATTSKYLHHVAAHASSYTIRRFISAAKSHSISSQIDAGSPVRCGPKAAASATSPSSTRIPINSKRQLVLGLSSARSTTTPIGRRSTAPAKCYSRFECLGSRSERRKFPPK